ncbi:type II secretion system inner membrane protein GspF, partial [bacterium]|nr:type II secretion system inner membrane protein GspF [bacterium]
YSYSAVDTAGKQKKGSLEAESPRQIRQLLREQGLMPVNVEPAGERARTGGKRSSLFSRHSLSAQDLAMITRQLATLLQAAIPLEEALNTIGRQSDKSKISALLLAVRAKVLEGHSLADSLSDYPSAFPESYRATVAAGESAGHLDAVLDRLADHTENAQVSRQKVKLAMIYPVILFIISIGVVALLMTFVVPKVVKVFTGQGQELPAITQAMIAISDFIVNKGWLLILIVVLLVMLSRWLLSQPHIRLAWHRRLLHLPLIGRFSRGANTAQFASTLSILSASGVPLVDALKISGKVLSNHWLREKVVEATQQVREGSSLNKALSTSGYFPPMMLHMIASGEQSGELDQMLDRTAQSQQRDLEALIGVLLGILEPVMLLFMAVCVFVIVIAILLPIVNLNDLI